MRIFGDFFIIELFEINPHTPVAQKVTVEVVFGRFHGEEVEFF